MSFINTLHYIKLLFCRVRPGKASFFFVFLTCSLFNFSSCKHTKQNNPKPHTANPAIEKAKSLYIANSNDRTIAHFDSVCATLPNPGTYDLWTKYDVKINYYYYFTGSFTKAKLCADSMLNVLNGKEKEFGVEYAHTLMINGDILMAERRYEEALQSYYAGSLFAQNNLDPCSSGQFNSQLGSTLYHQRNYRKGILYLKRAMDEESHCSGDIAGMQVAALNTIALCFEKARIPDSAIYYYKKGLTYIDKNFPKGTLADIERGIVYGNLGGTYGAVKNYDLAQRYLKASIDINNRPGYAPEDAKTAQIKLAHLYISYAHIKEADRLLHQIDAEWKAGRGAGFIDDTIKLRWRKLQWEYFDKIHNAKKAYVFSKSYYLLRDSLNETLKGLEHANIEEGLKETEQQYSVELLSKSNQLKTTYLSAIIVFSLLILIILLMAWYNLKQSGRNLLKLTDLNRIVSDYNAQLQNALAALEESYEENSNLMQIVAHDLRAPIGGIAITASKMLEQSMLPSGERATLEMIAASAKDSLSLVSGLLKNYTSVKDFKMEPVDMHALLEHCVTIMRVKAEEKSQRIELDAGYFTVFINREKMWRVIVNLIANAIKFSPTGAIIRVTMLKREDKVLITVDDDGVGIPLNMRDKVFDMFTEARRPGTNGEQPFGIGLAVSKQIVEMHGGKIWFENEPPNGTTMYVELPYKAAV
jgi:signal transduction histidine kinase